MSESNNSYINPILGTATATLGGVGTKFVAEKLTSKPIKKMRKKLLDEILAENSLFKYPVLRTLNDHKIPYKDYKLVTDLKNDAYAINFMKTRNKQPLTFLDNLFKAIKYTILPEKYEINYFNKLKNKSAKRVAGQNACALGEKVYLNFDKASAMGFHEAGHTINYKNSWGRVLQTLKHPLLRKICITGACLGAVLSPSKTKEEKENIRNNGSFKDKTLLTLKENSTGLALAGTLPLILEEGLASYHGNKLAAEVLNPKYLNKLKLMNAKSLTTYGLKGAIVVGSVFAASKIRDLFK